MRQPITTVNSVKTRWNRSGFLCVLIFVHAPGSEANKV
jgi:hypothetical protein